MIKSSNLYFQPMLGFYQSIKNILDGIKIIAFTDTGLIALSADMQTVFIDFDAVMRRTQGSVHTQNLISLDEVRDGLLIGLGGVLSSYENINDAAKKDAARLLLGYYDTYGDEIARLPYGEETAAITNLVQDFKRPEAQPAMALLSFLNDWITPLQSINKQFETLSNTRDSETTITEAGLSKQYRKKLQDLLNRFARQVNAVLLVSNNTDATAQKAADVVNAAVLTAQQRYRPGGNGNTPNNP